MSVYKGRTVVEGGIVEGEALVSAMPFGFFGGVNPGTGVVIDRWHDLFEQNMKGKILIYPEGRGSTVGAAIILELVRTGCAPKAILFNASEIITVTGGVLAKKFYDTDLPMLDRFGCDITKAVKTGDIVRVNPAEGTVEILSSK
ncbi:MAG TPA: DUF126 domain-containing protein [Clostridia bacterium]|nr:DUF126 domain-containing protein [Clostridia bacterium]